LLTTTDTLYWLALRAVPGLGPRKSNRLIEQFRTPEAIFASSRRDLEAAGLSGSIAQTITSGCTFEDAADQQQKLQAIDAHVISITDPRYPALLKEIYDPPPILFARGRLELLQTFMLGVVGTRRPSAYGMAAAERLSADLAQAGLTIVSGMARGIDTSAHKSALAIGGNTIAVFGCGIDVLYPEENRKLQCEIAEKGLLLSDFPMGTPGYPQNFPMRNRIISGLSLGVLIVEGAQYSGSAITARLALEQQREVFAIPGNITSKLSWAPNLLIKQGAKLVQDFNDVLEELAPECRRALAVRASERSGGQLELNQQEETALSPICMTLLAGIPPDIPIHLDLLLETFPRFTSSETIAALFELEMLGVVRQVPGKSFIKVW
jgi:DNA processing protein